MSVPWSEVLTVVLTVAVIAVIGEGLSRVIRRVGHRAGVREGTLSLIRDIIRAIWVVVAVIGVTYESHLASELTVVAVSTVGGLIVSLALQATISNFIAGMLLIQGGTLRLGDDITYSSVRGKVVRIALLTSWIMTDDGVIAAVANSQLMNGPLINRTATGRLSSRYYVVPEPKHSTSGANDAGAARPPPGSSSPDSPSGGRS